MQRRLREAAFLLLAPVAVYLMLCLLTYSAEDPGWNHAAAQAAGIHNLGGVIGAWIADIAFSLFGYLAYAFPLLLFGVGAASFRNALPGQKSALEPTLRLVGGVAFFIGGSGLVHLQFSGASMPPGVGAGGVLGEIVGGQLQRGFGHLGASLFLFAIFLVALTLATGLSWFRVMDAIGRGTLVAFGWLGAGARKAADIRVARVARSEREETRKIETVRQSRREPIKIEPTLAPIEKSRRAEAEQQIPLFSGIADSDLPPLSLLDEPQQQVKGYSEDTLEALSRQVELKLKDFRIDAHVVGVFPGPVITRFELQPAPGIKGSQISNLDKDIARGLSVISVRVVDVIPGKSVIGLEIPNANREIVYLSEILRSEKYDTVKSPLALALGKDIGGRAVVVDLAKMPHLLVAGTTGSGKSVALNAMVLSLLYKATARDVRMIMIDPKMLELSVYEGIPHLLAPVVTDMKEAANALRWCVAEMERRYKLMAAVGVRNLASFNKKVKDAIDSGKPLSDPLFKAPENTTQPIIVPTLEPLPYVVVIIDEFADMMMLVGKKVEELIARLAQKARAAGVHLILATQRPSVDVITGLIKANIPTRIAFQVSSKIDSRTILDQSGAETLLGHGDMLYLPPGTATPERVHGAFVGDDEVHKVVAHLRNQGKPDYIENVFAEVQSLGDGRVVGESGLPEDAEEGEGDYDELYDKAVAIVTESRRASISGVQRRLKIGYNRAARLIERMEADGIVSPPEHNGNREVLAPPPPEI
ncbi:MAG: DNA translocase FtsK 4TM domain-containing protein [Proteobacteria bacterium]|nr:DNA translocase FtsK 4TM domain-containing protein [Pseudomonadota bacterium]